MGCPKVSIKMGMAKRLKTSKNSGILRKAMV
jgi:hypothetical protein